MINLCNQGYQLHVTRIRELERRLCVILPADYVSFLLKQNGGTCRRPLLYTMLEPVPGGPGGLTYFYGVDLVDGTEFNDLSRLWSLTEFGRGLLPIAGDGAGVILLSCPPEGDGDIFLSLSGASEETILHRVSRSFAEFTGSLYDPATRVESSAFDAVEQDNAIALRNLLANGLQVEQRNEDGETLLFFACSRNSPECVRALLEHDADVTAKDREGEWPIHAAVTACALDCLRLLVHHGASLEVATAFGETPLILASKYPWGLDAILQFLLLRGADIKATDAGQGTPLCWRCTHIDREFRFVNMLIDAGSDTMHAAEWLSDYIARMDVPTISPFNGLSVLGAYETLVDLTARGYISAMEELVALGDVGPEFLGALRSAMMSSDAQTRAIAAQNLGRTKVQSVENVRSLKAAAMGDTDAGVRRAAQDSLSELT